MNMNTRTTIRWPTQEYQRVRSYAEAHKVTLSAAIREMLIKQATLSAEQRTGISEDQALRNVLTPRQAFASDTQL